ncbi:MAG: SCP2 sterol-binding domain-containing protein [Acidimicrobiales bacterium]
MPQYPFLSEEWIKAAREVHEANRGVTQPVPVPGRVNLVITGVPFGDGSVNAHIDTGSGEMELELGHLDMPDATITLDYQTARSIFVDSDAQAVMQAFMSGKIRMEGDVAKVMAMVAALQPVGPAAATAAGDAVALLREITAP